MGTCGRGIRAKQITDNHLESLLKAHLAKYFIGHFCMSNPVLLINPRSEKLKVCFVVA